MKGRKPVDLTGRRFTRLVVLGRAANMGDRVAWRCQCDCGNTRVVRAHSLIDGNTTSCGCYRRTAGQERMRLQSLSRAAQKRYRPVDEVLAEVFRNPLDLLAAHVKAALAEVEHSEVTA